MCELASRFTGNVSLSVTLYLCVQPSWKPPTTPTTSPYQTYDTKNIPLAYTAYYASPNIYLWQMKRSLVSTLVSHHDRSIHKHKHDEHQQHHNISNQIWCQKFYLLRYEIESLVVESQDGQNILKAKQPSMCVYLDHVSWIFWKGIENGW